jgi:hypothetical protein
VENLVPSVVRKKCVYEYKMANAWMTQVRKTMKKMSGQKKTLGKKWFTHVLKAAKMGYKKHGGEAGGEEGGKRRRTRRHRK